MKFFKGCRKKYAITNLFICFNLLLMVSASYAGSISNDLKNIIKNLSLCNAIEVIQFEKDKYVVSIADAEISGSTATDKLNAMKEAKLISQANLSKFINGENISIKETLSTIRVVKSTGGDSEIVKDEETFEEFIKNKSRGILNNIKFVRWSSDGAYYVATIIKISVTR